MGQDQGQRTEQPTQRKLEKARQQGQFLSARDAVGAIQFTAATAMLVFLGPAWWASTQDVLRSMLRAAFERDVTTAWLGGLTWHVVSQIFFPLLAAGALLAALSLGVQLAFSSVGFSFQAVMPQFSRINPVKKLRETAKQCLATAGHVLVMIGALSILSYWIVSDQLPGMLSASLAAVQSGIARLGASVADLLWKSSAVLVVFGAVDLFRQKRKLDKQLRMTKQEVRDEMKENEGNPQIKAQIRRLRRQLLRGRMMAEVPRASVVVVNPTHYSVALRYDPETMASPVVVAMGKNYLAKLIREKASKHHVPIVENPPLARALYGSASVGQQIPVEFYRAVAEILAYLHRMMSR